MIHSLPIMKCYEMDSFSLFSLKILASNEWITTVFVILYFSFELWLIFVLYYTICIPNHSFQWKTRTEQNSLMSRRMSLFPFLVVVIQITFCLVTASVANIFVCPVLGSFDPSETLWLKIQFKMPSGRCWNETYFRKQKI